MASGTYGSFWVDLLEGNINTTTLKAQLTLKAHTPNFDTHTKLVDVEGDKVVGTTDQDMTGRTVTKQTAQDEVELDYDSPVTWTSVAAGEIFSIIVYDNTGATSSDKRLVCYNELASSIQANGSNIQITLDAEGILKVGYG